MEEAAALSNLLFFSFWKQNDLPRQSREVFRGPKRSSELGSAELATAKPTTATKLTEKWSTLRNKPPSSIIAELSKSKILFLKLRRQNVDGDNSSCLLGTQREKEWVIFSWPVTSMTGKTDITFNGFNEFTSSLKEFDVVHERRKDSIKICLMSQTCLFPMWRWIRCCWSFTV